MSAQLPPAFAVGKHQRVLHPWIFTLTVALGLMVKMSKKPVTKWIQGLPFLFLTLPQFPDQVNRMGGNTLNLARNLGCKVH